MRIKKTRRANPSPIPSKKSILVYAEAEPPTLPQDFEQKDTESSAGTLTVFSILRYIALNQGVNSPKLAAFFNKTMKLVSRFTTELRYRNFIEFRGSLNKGGYFLKPDGLKFLENPDAAGSFAPKRMTGELVLEFIRENPGANHYAIAAHFQRTIKSATRHTLRLRKKDKITFRGTPRDGGFYAKKPKAESRKNAPAEIAGNL
ncbi:MAG: hypothetical protein IJW12_03725 [Opitutales bacterium]|nr:hypothetical protein [Opitutales bacterium]